MNPDQILAQLKPVHLPLAPGWWPLAPGWWVLSGLVIFSLILLALLLRRRYRKRLWRRQALETLNQLTMTAMSARDKLEAIEKLIKQVARIRYADQPSNALTGDAWIQFLKQQPESKKLTEEDYSILSEGLYKPTSPSLPDSFFLHIRQWIKAGN
jgi:membrane protein implicated in regulation of membrane protease activity